MYARYVNNGYGVSSGLIDTKYSQMAFLSARWRGSQIMCCLGTPGQTKIRQSKINSRSVAGPMGQMNRRPRV